jgi:hypothetical protein
MFPKALTRGALQIHLNAYQRGRFRSEHSILVVLTKNKPPRTYFRQQLEKDTITLEGTNNAYRHERVFSVSWLSLFLSITFCIVIVNLDM